MSGHGKGATLVMLACITAIALYLAQLSENVSRGHEPKNDDVVRMHSEQTISLRTTLLLGIFTTDTGLERTRRQRIRDTYLSFKNDPRVCPLKKYKEDPSGACQIIYTFVIGANPAGATELVDESIPLTVDPTLITNAESDAVYLNIRENMDEEKSQTFFKYASTVADRYRIEYVAKCDSDSLVFTPSFLNFIDENLPPAPHNQRIYAGKMYDMQLCGGLEKAHCLALTGKVYMVGQLYVMSADLAYYITTDAVDRRSLSVGYEDYDIGAFILSHPKPVNVVPLLGHQKFWRHPLKEDEEWIKFWMKYINRPEEGQ